MSDQENKKVYNLVILDESGSMEAIKPAIISGFNELVQTIRLGQANFPEQQHFVSLVTFNGEGVKTLLDRQSVDSLPQLNEENYRPNAMTPLYDAMGASLNALREATAQVEDAWHLVTILTDGEENSSREYSGKAISELVKELDKGNWTFTYIGANHDVMSTAANLNIKNTMAFNADVEGSRAMWQKESEHRMHFYEKMHHKSDSLKEDFFLHKGEDKDANNS